MPLNIDYDAAQRTIRAQKAQLLAAVAEGGTKAKEAFESAQAEVTARKQAAAQEAASRFSGPGGDLARIHGRDIESQYQSASQNLRATRDTTQSRIGAIGEFGGKYLDTAADQVPKYQLYDFLRRQQENAENARGRGGRGGGGGGGGSDDDGWYYGSKFDLDNPGLSKTEFLSGAKEYIRGLVNLNPIYNKVPGNYAARRVAEEYGMPESVARGLFKFKNDATKKVASRVRAAVEQGATSEDILRTTRAGLTGKESDLSNKARIKLQNLARFEVGKQPRTGNKKLTRPGKKKRRGRR